MLKHNSRSQLALLLTDDLLDAWKTTCGQIRLTEFRTKQVNTLRDVLTKFIRYGDTRRGELYYQMRAMDPNSRTQGNVDAMDAITAEDRRLERKVMKARRMKRRNGERSADLMREELHRSDFRADAMVMNALIAHGSIPTHNEFDYAAGLDSGLYQAVLDRFKVPEED
jgi:hypothetical protein